MTAWMRALALMILAPLALSGCFLVPGKFTSTLDIRRDRTFTFTYQGEVIATDPAKDGLGTPAAEETPAAASLHDAALIPVAVQKDEKQPGEDAAKKAAADTKYRAMADALRKEAGFRSVEYLGDGKFQIDYAITSTLTHNFVFPFNVDAEAVFPFVVLELRGKDGVRVKAPAFGDDDSTDKLNQLDKDKGANPIDGSFTLTTDAEIVSQNNEAGAAPTKTGKAIVWRVTPASKDTPMAVLKLKPLP